jgi:hypothetical protein
MLKRAPCSHAAGPASPKGKPRHGHGQHGLWRGSRPHALGSEYSTGPLGQRFLAVTCSRETVPIRSHCRPNSDTDVCEVKGVGSVPRPTRFSAPLGPRLAGLFRERHIHSRRQLFANPVMARLIASVIVATALAACAGHVADYIPTWAFAASAGHPGI